MTTKSGRVFYNGVQVTPAAAELSEAVDLVVDSYVGDLTSHEVISALEAVLDGAKRDSET